MKEVIVVGPEMSTVKSVIEALSKNDHSFNIGEVRDHSEVDKMFEVVSSKVPDLRHKYKSRKVGKK